MDLAAFEASVAGELPPAGLSGPLRALWWDAKGEAAHDWVHAYLHRKEPDPANAAYWYRRAGREVATGPFAAEWREIATALLG
jgi:hypothetical protein